jgi:ribosomal protein S11
MWNEKERKGKERKGQVKEQRQRVKRKKRKRKRRRRKRKGRRNRRGGRQERWCRVSSEATNTKVVRTWAEKKESGEGAGRKGRNGKKGVVGKAGVRKPVISMLNRPVGSKGVGSKGVGRKGGVRRKSAREKRGSYGSGNGRARKRKSVVKSAGNRGYKSIRHRGTDYAARKVVGRARKKCTSRVKGKVGVHVRREGTGKGSKARRKRVSINKMKLRSVSDRTREAHNGCKGKKARRR